MTRVVVVGDLMTDTVAHAALPLAKGSDTPATVTMHGGGSGANIAAWLAVDGAEVAFVGRRGADIAGRNRDMELMGYGVDARLVMDPERPTGTCVVMVTHRGDHTMLSDPGASFCDPGPGFYATASPRARKRGHIRQLEALGYKVTFQPAA